MPTLIEMIDGAARGVDDGFVFVADDQDLPDGDLLLSLTRFQAEGESLLSQGRRVGVKLLADQEVEALAYDLPRLSVVALDFPKFGDGRSYSNARLLRERYGFKGQVRAVGDVLREQAGFLLRVGFDAFEPADGASDNEWQAATLRYRHVFQRASDARAPVYLEREA